MKSLTTLTLTLLALSSTVSAKPANHHYDYAKVVRATPVYDYVKRRIPVEECWQSDYRPSKKRKSHVPTVVGSIIGGAVGHAIGHNKSNKKVGMVAGAALGAAIGSDVGEKSRGRHYDYHPQQHCETSYHVEREQRLTGYKVTYRYHGHKYHTRTKYHPGDRIRVKISVKPVRERYYDD